MPNEYLNMSESEALLHDELISYMRSIRYSFYADMPLNVALNEEVFADIGLTTPTTARVEQRECSYPLKPWLVANFGMVGPPMTMTTRLPADCIEGVMRTKGLGLHNYADVNPDLNACLNYWCIRIGFGINSSQYHSSRRWLQHRVIHAEGHRIDDIEFISMKLMEYFAGIQHRA